MMIPKAAGVCMNLFWIASNLVLWLVVLFMGLLLVGTLRALSLVRWRLQQLEATTPSRLGRRGLKRGTKAPDFNLPSVEGGDFALRDFAGRKILLVFTQSGCAPCRRIVPELNRLNKTGDLTVLVVNKGEFVNTQKWACEAGARFPVLVQEDLSVSRHYEVFATPFAFLIDEQGVICSKGIVGEPNHLRWVLAGVTAGAENGQAQSERSPAEVGA
jgi:methylamine dehydrogenase accessory protein MauD